ncbi:MAG TPA: ankyrin repeat domain-containing protein [Bryobacteraceae bacterium]|nr:ankyrin repeat domain-containing protein [Bryobacteraceae bacterium]
MSQQFFEAIRAGDRAKVDALLSSDASLLNAEDDKGLSAFAAAKYSGRNEIATLLLEKGVELDIFTASMAGARERANELLHANPDLAGAYSRDGWTPLHLACFFAIAEMVADLIEKGADVNARSQNPMQNMPLHAAAARRNRDAVRVLLENGAGVNARQEGGWTALHAAAQNGDAEMARLLIAAGADVAARASNQQNAMDLALTKGHQAVVDLLDEYAPSTESA